MKTKARFPKILYGFFGGILITGSLSFIYITGPEWFSVTYAVPTDSEVPAEPAVETEEPEEPAFVATHVAIPPAVKAIYMTSWVAGTERIRTGLVKLIEETELNAVVIDIKDYSGRVSFRTENPLVEAIGSEEVRVPDMREFIEELHAKGIYVIGRISVFQDPHLTHVRPELAVKKESATTTIWKDNKGLSFTDPGASDVWKYHVEIAKAAYDAGFDELNFDYIRYPSDGPMNDIYYPWSGEKVQADPRDGKPEVLEGFFKYLSTELKQAEYVSGEGPVLSADLFGMTATNYDDLNIGQVLERALPYFDYIAPMVYPSHYPPTFIGLANPAANPYEVIKYSMDKAVGRLIGTTTPVKTLSGTLISTTTGRHLYSKPSYDIQKLRPWLQDFDLGAIYTPEMVRAQIQATYDSDLTSWMLWDAANTYTRDALLTE